MQRNFIPVVLANGSTRSAVASCSNLRLAGVFIPAGFSGTVLTLLAIPPQGDPSLVSDGAGSSYSRTVRAGDYVPIPYDVGQGITGVQFVSGTSQSGAVTLLAVFVDT